MYMPRVPYKPDIRNYYEILFVIYIRGAFRALVYISYHVFNVGASI
jgi:hypothetical protein